MKRILFALQLAMLLLSIPVAMNAQDLQKVYLNKGSLYGEGWDNYSLEMGHKSANNIYSYTFHKEEGGLTYFRIKIERGEQTFIIAPLGDNDVPLTAGTYTEVSGEPNEDRSFYFNRKANTTYTIRLKWDNFYDGKYNGLKVAYYEGDAAPSSVEGYPSRPRLISDNDAFNNKAFI